MVFHHSIYQNCLLNTNQHEPCVPVLKKLLVVPRVNTKRYGERAFSVIGPRLWNSLPQNLRDITNLEHFKKNLKTVFV